MKARRARWARGADKVASWFALELRGTDKKGRARLPLHSADVTISTVRRSSAIAKAESVKPQSRPTFWLHVHLSKKHPNTVALIVDAKTAEKLCQALAAHWAFASNSPTAFPSGSLDSSIGGTTP